jgi:predicted nucleic acid-binding protein
MRLRVIVNASPLIFLAKSGLLGILKRLFSEVYTTKGVMDEVEKPLKFGVKASEVLTIKAANWINVVKLKAKEKQEAKKLAARLGIALGEAEAAVLYQRGFDLLIVADRKAERKFREIGLNVTDLVNVGFKAATKGLIDIKDFANAIWKAGYRTERVERILRINPS